MQALEAKHLHIVSFNVPYPPDYGGVIDVFYKIKALHELGIKVHLHCFQYGREVSPELDSICEKVYYYPRKSFYRVFYSPKPFIVSSRQSDALLNNLLDNDYPIFFEGLHTCFYLQNKELDDRVKCVRMHNVEWDYYRSLGKADQNYFRKFYFYTESMRLKSFESILEKASMTFAISAVDVHYFMEKYKHVYHIPPFHENEAVTSLTGIGNYVLYHGNLSVTENNQAAMWLVNKVFDDIEDIQLIIAGSHPNSMLLSAIKKRKNIILKTNPTHQQMNVLIQNAQINLLPTFQNTGLKLKLVNSLYKGRHCIVNIPMIEGSGLESLCEVKNSVEEIKQAVKEFMKIEFRQGDIKKREEVLYNQFSNKIQAERMSDLIFNIEEREINHTD